MSNKMKLSGLTDLLKGLDVESLEGVTIEGDI
jgi:acetyl-CoA decarbonylase/synthase complex subunit delta